MVHSSLLALPLVALLAFSNGSLGTPCGECTAGAGPAAFHAHHFHAGQKLVASFTPNNGSAQLAFAFCTDVEATKCNVVNLVGHKDGHLAAYFFRKGEAVTAAAAGDHAHHDHSHEGHTHSDHSHHQHHDHTPTETPSPLQEPGAGGELEKTLKEMQRLAEELASATNSTVIALGALPYAWMPPNDVALEDEITPIDLVYNRDNLNVWEPLSTYEISVLKGDGKVKVLLQGGAVENAARLSWPMDDSYMHTTVGVRFGLGSVTVTGPVAA